MLNDVYVIVVITKRGERASILRHGTASAKVSTSSRGVIRRCIPVRDSPVHQRTGRHIFMQLLHDDRYCCDCLLRIECAKRLRVM